MSNESMAAERRELEKQIAGAKQEIARHQSEKTRLQAQLQELEHSWREVSERTTQIEQQASDLANLYVASSRLHESVDRKEVLTAIQEIVINLVGSEELAVFEMSDDGATLELVDSFGIEPGAWSRVSAGDGAIGAAAKGTSTMGEQGVTACVPLMAGGKTVGAVALFRLLPQKAAGLQQLDRDLLEVLRSQAGLALYCAKKGERT